MTDVVAVVILRELFKLSMAFVWNATLLNPWPPRRTDKFARKKKKRKESSAKCDVRSWTDSDELPTVTDRMSSAFPLALTLFVTYSSRVTLNGSHDLFVRQLQRRGLSDSSLSLLRILVLRFLEQQVGGCTELLTVVSASTRTSLGGGGRSRIRSRIRSRSRLDTLFNMLHAFETKLFVASGCDVSSSSSLQSVRNAGLAVMQGPIAGVPERGFHFAHRSVVLVVCPFSSLTLADRHPFLFVVTTDCRG